MVMFDPELTEMIFFDLEFYIPEQDRNRPGASLLANPGRTGHHLLGGVFSRFWPLKDKISELSFDHFWFWDYKNEKQLLKVIFDYFKESWDSIRDKEPRHADLILCGIGISRFDLPILYIRSLIKKIDTNENIFELYFKTKPVDLSNVTIPFFNREKVMYPKTANQILTRFSLEKNLASSMNVWEKFDNKDYEWIQQRTENEVKNSIKLYTILCNRIYQDKKKMGKIKTPTRKKY
jgi:hypothetical protein